jgi:N utilization substance protein B
VRDETGVTNGEESTRGDRGSGRRAPKRPGGDGTTGKAAGRQPAGGKRHQGRILALQLLYEADVAGHGPDEVLARTFAEQPPSAAVRAHVERLVRGVVAERDEIDPYIAAAAPAFPLAQMAAIDRNVLRLAVFELLREAAVPPRAAINEAVELAKRFGGDNSSRFVNGVLGTIVERVPRPSGAKPGRAGAVSATPDTTPESEAASEGTVTPATAEADPNAASGERAET